MYRQRIKMSAEVVAQPSPDHQFLSRVNSLPVVTAAVDQLFNIYQSTKAKNSLFRYTLEGAENGVKIMAVSALPVINKLEKPIGSLDHFACNQLDKLEQKYPVITKPTDQLVEGTKHLYDTTIKSPVDTVASVTQFGVATYTSAKDYSVDKVNSVKTYTFDTVEGVKKYTHDTVEGVKQYSYGKLNGAMETPYGQVAASQLGKVLDVTERYVDYYLPEQEPAEGEEGHKEEVAVPGDSSPLNRAVTLSSKTRQRLYARAMRDLHNVQLRSKEALAKLGFTIDLIQYAKTNIDGKVGAAWDKLGQVWEEVNLTEEEAAEREVSAGDENDPANQQAARTFERRAIATARHLTRNLKANFARINTAAALIPAAFRTHLATTTAYVDQLYKTFATATKFDDLSTHVLDTARDRIHHLTEALNFAVEYAQSLGLGWLALPQKSQESGIEPKEESEKLEK